MNRRICPKPSAAALLCASLSLAGVACAQETVAPAETTACPQLPASSGLTWQYRSSGDADLCRALRGDGSEAFGLYISAKPTFEPNRGDRKEQGQIDGHEVTWYQAELAAKPDVLGRETVLQLPDGRSAHVWLQADSAERLDAGFQLVQGLHFRPGRGDRQVAGQ